MEHKHLPHDHGHLSRHLQHSIPGDNTFSAVSELMKLMSDEKRLQLFWMLCHCEECVVNLAALLDMSSPAASHHLKQLKNAGLIISRREGKEVYYTAAHTHRSQVLHQMIESIIEVTCPAELALSPAYDTQTQTVSQIHDFITKDLTARHTVEALSQRFHINQTTLKTVFKRVYGQPIGTYMKHYRIHAAMELLRDGSKSIGQVAALVGYESQSKFTRAFQEVTGVKPKDYRK